MNKELPKVAIVGRPNVGKSSLYNRIIGKRKSIIHKRPGVTRDRSYSLVSHNSYNFLLVDTGGIEEDTGSTFIEHIIEQANMAIQEANLILFVVDTFAIVPDDYAIASLLRNTGKEIIVVVNKADTRSKEDSLAFELGFSNLLFISAIHGRNTSNLLDMICTFIPLVEPPPTYDELDKINVAIIGRPNVGKSSLLNRILGRERSLVSEIPGTTRDAIEESMLCQGYRFTFIDTAGMRRRSKVNDDIEYYSVNRAIRSIEQSDVAIHLISSIDSISEQDKKILSVAVGKGKAMIIAINKWDIMEEGTNFADYVDRIRFKFAIGNYIPIINISATKGTKIRKLLSMVVDVYGQYRKTITTSQLNKVLDEAKKKHSQSTKKGALKLYYGTQLSKAPPRFLLFINKQELLTKNYKDYLINTLRKSFGYSGVPIIIHTKKSI